MLLKIHIKSKKLQIKVVWNGILYKKVLERICLSHPGVKLGPRKIDMDAILYCTETANYIQFRTECCQKY